MGFLSNLIGDIKKDIGKTYSSTGNGNKINYSADSSTGNYNGPIVLDDSNNNKKNTGEYSHNGIFPSRETVSTQSIIDVPAWGYKDYINERVNFQKGLDSMLSEPAWLYFKIFFKFNTKYGLFGGIMKDSVGQKYSAANTAIQYLYRNRERNALDGLNRIKALVKFTRTLSFISSNAPWFFSSVKDVNSGLTMNLQNLTAEKSIEIECCEDATDMRLLTLMDLYKYVAYDSINQKEILPENLRKFDVDIIVFQVPIRYFHTSSRDLKGRHTVYKNLNSSNMEDRMSFKMFSFYNCEIDYDSLNNFLPQTFANDKPFTSKPTFKLKYDRVYQHNQNEYAQMLFGDTGLLWNKNEIDDTTSLGTNYNANTVTIKNEDGSDLTSNGNISNIKSKSQQETDTTRKTMLKYALDNKYYFNSSSQTYKAIVDATESTLSAAMMLIDGNAGLGNLYGETSKWYSGVKSVGQSTVKAFKDTWNKGIKNFIGLS